MVSIRASQEATTRLYTELYAKEERRSRSQTRAIATEKVIMQEVLSS